MVGVVVHHDIILTLSGGLVAALLLGYCAHKIGMSPIVGYLLAGIVVGPHTPGFMASQAVAEQFAEIGIILLMFGVGLRFHLEELLAVWRVAVPGALIQSAAITAVAGVALHAFGLPWSAAVVVGMAISVASTVVLVRVLNDHRDLHTPTGHIAVGWVVVEDLLTIGLLVILPLLAEPAVAAAVAAAATADAANSATANSATAAAAITLATAAATASATAAATASTTVGSAAVHQGWAAAIALGSLAAFIGVMIVGGGRAIPWVLHRIARTRSSELFTLTILALALGIAVIAAKLFGVSMALGAFLAGVVVGRSEFAARAAGDALPMRDAFAVLFFVSVGMLFDPRHLFSEALVTAVVLALVVVGKPVIAAMFIRAMGRPWALACSVGATLGQVGEFTFILGTTARLLNLIDERAWNTLVAVAMISIALNPLLYRWALRWGRDQAVAPTLHANGPADPTVDLAAAGPGTGGCIVVGYGPVGRHVVNALRAQGIPVAIVERNLATIRFLVTQGYTAVAGDAVRLETLLKAGLDRAAALIISSDMPEPGEVIRVARAHRPTVRVMVRCARLSDAGPLRDLGAEVVIAAEGEIALTLTEAVLAAAGADPKTMAQTRAVIRATLPHQPANVAAKSGRDIGHPA